MYPQGKVKYKREKPPQNTTMHENGATQKEVQRVDHLSACFLKSGWLTNLPNGNGGWRKREPVKHEKIEQMKKIETIGFLLHKAL